MSALASANGNILIPCISREDWVSLVGALLKAKHLYLLSHNNATLKGVCMIVLGNVFLCSNMTGEYRQGWLRA